MTYIWYKDWLARAETLHLVEQCNAILEGDLADYQVTLRQLYYQLVSKNILDNSLASYSKLSGICTRARLAGLMDWDRIVDRVRQPQQHAEFSGLQQLTEVAARSYRLPRWMGQTYYVELWVEKDALASVLWPIAKEHHVTLMINRGYSSSSAMKQSADRYIRQIDQGKQAILLYLGDLDPSGEDMVRDISERLSLFEAHVQVLKIALTHEQVLHHAPPPNPAKVSDPRATGYIAKYGKSSWEVDALHPTVLTELIHTEISSYLDYRLMEQVIKQEALDLTKLRAAVVELEEEE